MIYIIELLVLDSDNWNHLCRNNKMKKEGKKKKEGEQKIKN